VLTTRQLEDLDRLQRDTFSYFWERTNPDNGLVPDSSRTGGAASIAATGMALACYVVGVEHRWINPRQAVERILATLRTFAGPKPRAVSEKGFFHHFLDLETAGRAWKSEFSTMDTAILIAGALTAAAYFDNEQAIGDLAAELYDRAEWDFARDGGATVTHGWTPEAGFLRYRWEGYNEGLLLYALAAGSLTHALPASSYKAATRSYRWKTVYGIEYLYAGPLFIHQLPHLWIDFRTINDAFMRKKGTDYFVNSQRATEIQQRYAIRNPGRFQGYGEHVWGITASDGPGPAVKMIDGRRRRFWDYRARGVPWGPDDGTLAPWAVVASLPFQPELVVRTLAEIDRRHPEMRSEFGYKCSFNPTHPGDGDQTGWISSGYYGIEQGPVVLAIENFRSEMIWGLMRDCSPLVRGLRRIGFAGGWLEEG
jgi:hypothetical protein